MLTLFPHRTSQRYHLAERKETRRNQLEQIGVAFFKIKHILFLKV